MTRINNGCFQKLSGYGPFVDWMERERKEGSMDGVKEEEGEERREEKRGGGGGGGAA